MGTLKYKGRSKSKNSTSVFASQNTSIVYSLSVSLFKFNRIKKFTRVTMLIVIVSEYYEISMFLVMICCRKGVSPSSPNCLRIYKEDIMHSAFCFSLSILSSHCAQISP